MSVRLTYSASFAPAKLFTIRVGEGAAQTDFVAHESFLTSRSEYFRHAFNGNWEEASTRTIKLAHDDPKSFELYLGVVYTGKIALRESMQPEAIEKPWKEERSLLRDQYDKVFGLYILAEKLQDSTAKNAAIQATFELVAHGQRRSDKKWTFPRYSTVANVFDKTPSQSPARRLLVDMANTCNVESLHAEAATLPKDLVRDLLVCLRMRVKGRNGAIKKGLNAYLETTTEMEKDDEETGNE